MDDVVADDELLYRCVFCGLGKNYHIRGAIVEISSQAFTDRHEAPSVDRAQLCDCNPAWTQKNSDAGVVSLIAGEVRKIDIVQKDADGNKIFTYAIDVCPRPSRHNPAHAQIEPSPDYASRSTFRKVIEKLARLATERVNQHNWEIKPRELRP